MSHWVAILKEKEEKVFTGKTKEEVIFEVGSALTNKSRYLASTVQNQLKMNKESTSIAYGSEHEEIAKVFKCNCGSVVRHKARVTGTLTDRKKENEQNTPALHN